MIINTTRPTAKKILLICNPISGYSDKYWLDALCEQINQDGYFWQRYDTQSSGDATRYLIEENWQADLIIVAGGDGTINEVAAGLLAKQCFDTPILALSTGTANVLARELGINGLAKRHKIPEIMALIKQRPIREVQLATINQKAMLLMAGVGFDAWVVHKLDSNLKKRFGKLAYVVSMFKELSHASQRHYDLSIEDEIHKVNAAIVSNGRYYAGSYTLCPNGRLEDKHLTVTTITGNTAQFILALLALPLGLMHKCPGVDQYRVADIEITSPQENEPIQLDGDDFGMLPCRISSSDNCLKFIHKAH
ncbi:YegS/Rv2252/BmrU family lipid kinase [uncultured Pseudoteredinibacter sp.]|uniref:diacylglycerol/lipid kinase family protein n=1 Tax=uncultured Pseudoteredinibacter sp. TaxID=1641701 RepID=UPI00261B83F6|nr:YegS/Rv2252/BmrU family lipid kinase [uncultured Pseudoteredinibacter sp.]